MNNYIFQIRAISFSWRWQQLRLSYSSSYSYSWFCWISPSTNLPLQNPVKLLLKQSFHQWGKKRNVIERRVTFVKKIGNAVPTLGVLLPGVFNLTYYYWEIRFQFKSKNDDKTMQYKVKTRIRWRILLYFILLLYKHVIRTRNWNKLIDFKPFLFCRYAL